MNNIDRTSNQIGERKPDDVVPQRACSKCGLPCNVEVCAACASGKNPAIQVLLELEYLLEKRLFTEASPIRRKLRQAIDLLGAVETAGVDARDAARYRYIRQGEDILSSEDEEPYAKMWSEIELKGCDRERMDAVVDAAMAKSSSVETAEPLPFGWYRGFSSAGSPSEPPEYDWEAYVGDDPPTAEAGWMPFYREARVGLANAQEWHRLCEAIATILEVDSNADRDTIGRQIAEAIQRIRDERLPEEPKPSRCSKDTDGDGNCGGAACKTAGRCLSPEKAPGDRCKHGNEAAHCGRCLDSM